MFIFSYYGGYDYSLHKYLKKVPFLYYNVVYSSKTKKDVNPYKQKKKKKRTCPKRQTSRAYSFWFVLEKSGNS